MLPQSAPVDWSNRAYDKVKVSWRAGRARARAARSRGTTVAANTYRERVSTRVAGPRRLPTVHDHIWDDVNAHLGTDAHSFPELIEQLGVMRFGQAPESGDTFCGSGQIPFEAARLGCDVFASDLNPIACMLTWGAFHIVGGVPRSASKRSSAIRRRLIAKQGTG